MNAASQDALNGAAVECFEDQRAHAESFQPPEGGRGVATTVLVCVGHDRSLVIWTRGALDPLHFRPVDVKGVMQGPLFPVVHDQLLFVLLLFWHHTDRSLTLLPKVCLIIVSDQAYHRQVVSKMNEGGVRVARRLYCPFASLHFLFSFSMRFKPSSSQVHHRLGDHKLKIRHSL